MNDDDHERVCSSTDATVNRNDAGVEHQRYSPQQQLDDAAAGGAAPAVISIGQVHIYHLHKHQQRVNNNQDMPTCSAPEQQLQQLANSNSSTSCHAQSSSGTDNSPTAAQAGGASVIASLKTPSPKKVNMHRHIRYERVHFILPSSWI